MIGPKSSDPTRSVSLGWRESKVEQLRTRQFDLLVIGGGITGAGIALDAASRGLRVALIEKGDFASGTSSRSTKLVHGGLRYLAQLRFRLTREAVAERTLLQQLAPHLVEPIPFLFPIYNSPLEVLRVNTGLWLYDLMAGLRKTKVHRRLNRAETLARAPLLKREGLRAGFVYYDAQTDDARLVVEVLKSAVEYGAVVANYVQAESPLREGSRVSGVLARDVLTDSTAPILAHKVVLATGVWLDRTFAGYTGRGRVRPAKGVHLIVPRNRLDTQTAVAFPTPDGRLMFVIPWQGATLIGTTDTDYHGPLDEPRADRADLDYLLSVVNGAFPGAGLTDDDVISVQAGLRPLIDDGDGNTASLSREDRVYENSDGSIGIAGGKLTTYRKMGRKVVDLVVRRLRQEGRLGKKPRSVTGHLPLGGLPLRTRRRFSRLRRLGHLVRRRPRPTIPDAEANGLSPETVRRLWRSYGANWKAVAELLVGDPSLSEPVIPGLGIVKAEIVFAVRHEMARRLLDVLARRTHLALLDRDQARSVAPLVADLVGAELGWDEAERQHQIELYLQQVEQFSIEPLRSRRLVP